MSTSTPPQVKSGPDIGLSASRASRDSQAEPATPTPSQPVDLSDSQRQALEWLNDQTNPTVTDAAEFAGVSRTTFYRWVDTDPTFRALYMAWLRQQKRVGDAQVFASEPGLVEMICEAARDHRDLSAAKFIVKQAVARRQGYQREAEQQARARERAQTRAERRADRARELAQRREDQARELTQRRDDRAREIAQRREDRARELKQQRDDRSTGLEGLL
jgi:hypothetical protein